MGNIAYELVEVRDFADIHQGDLVHDFNGQIGRVSGIDRYIGYCTPTGGGGAISLELFPQTIFFRPKERKILAGTRAYALLSGTAEWTENIAQSEDGSIFSRRIGANIENPVAASLFKYSEGV